MRPHFIPAITSMLAFFSREFNGYCAPNSLNGRPDSISMRRGGTGLAPNPASAPPRRSSAIELSSLGYNNLANNNGSLINQGGATLGNNLGHYTGGSRSAATSPVGGASIVSSTLNLPTTSGNHSNLSATTTSGGSPRHNRTSNEAWVCPDDRQLALRAK